MVLSFCSFLEKEKLSSSHVKFEFLIVAFVYTSFLQKLKDLLQCVSTLKEQAPKRQSNSPAKVNVSLRPCSVVASRRRMKCYTLTWMNINHKITGKEKRDHGNSREKDCGLAFSYFHLNTHFVRVQYSVSPRHQATMSDSQYLSIPCIDLLLFST